MPPVYVCDGVPFSSFASARTFAKHYFERTGQVIAVEIDEATPESAPDAYGVVQYHRPNRSTRRKRRAAQKTAIYMQETRTCLR